MCLCWPTDVGWPMADGNYSPAGLCRGPSVPEVCSFFFVLASRRALDTPSANSQVLAMFKHAWQGYKKYAWGHDELGPLTKRGLDWSKLKREGFGFTILDGMSTMWLMDLKAEFEESVEWVDKHLSFAKDADMSQFEATIRMLGGLLSAYELSGEQHHVLVTKARDLGNRLLHAYNTTLGVPHAQV